MHQTLTVDSGSDREIAQAVRDTLHLEPGDRVLIESTEDGAIVRRELPGRGLIEENGLLVFDSGVDIGEHDIVQWIHDDRERRIKYLSGEVAEP